MRTRERRDRHGRCMRGRRSAAAGARARALIAAATLFALHRPASADPFFNLWLLGKDLTAGDTSYSNTISVNVGDSISYEILGQMAPTGTVNSSNGTLTITSLTQNVDGCNALKFDLFQLSTDPIQTNFSSTTTLLNGWQSGASASGGAVVSRGNGDNNLGGVRPVRLTGNFAGIDAVVLGTGTFSVASNSNGGGASSLGMRWSSGGTGSLKINNQPAFNLSVTTESSADPFVGYQSLTIQPAATSAGTWNVDASGNWSTPGNWQGNVPSTIGALANFGSAIMGNRTVTLDSARTVGSIAFDNNHSYLLAGASTLTLSAGGAGASISVASGSHAILAPVGLSSDLSVTITSAASTLTISSDLTASGHNLTKSGSGTLILKNLRFGSATINGGIVQVAASGQNSSSTSVLSALPAIASSSQLDVQDNALIISYSPADTMHSARDAIRNLLKNGRNAGPASAAPWNGSGGITSSYANSNGNGFNLAMGYADNLDLAAVRASGSFTIFGGQTVASNTVLIQLTRGADATLDGVVDGQDVAIIGNHFQKPGSVQWCFGDFDYSGTCDGSDVSVLGTTFGKTSPILSPAQMTAEFGAAFTSAFEAGQTGTVPEPASSVLIGLSLALPLIARPKKMKLNRAGLVFKLES